MRRVLEQGAVENLPGAQKASTAVPAIVPDAAAPPEKRRGGFRGRGRLDVYKRQIYGLVGMLFFAQMLGFQTSLLSGGCTPVSYTHLAGIRVAGVVLRFDPVGFHLLE